jgi:endonuclease G
MQKAQFLYLKNVKDLIQEDELSDAFDLLNRIDKDLQIGIENDLILQRARFKSNEKDMMSGILSAENYQRTKAQLRYALVNIVEGIPRKMELNEMLRGVKGMNFSVDDEALEKIMGDRSRMVKISWLEMALKATRSVGRIVRSNGTTGTGFLVEGNYLFTNNHVIPNQATADDAYVEFNFEEDISGRPKTRYHYHFDADQFLTNAHETMDYTRLKVLEKPGSVPLSEWGYLHLAPDALPVAGDPVNIIQHPKGDVKQIALTSNEVLSIWKSYLFYKADTEPGSSGSPVFNQSWQVVALHHAGKLMSEGGMEINAKGDKVGANRGILFRDILADISRQTR